jgi:hypothetical protein
MTDLKTLPASSVLRVLMYTTPSELSLSTPMCRILQTGQEDNTGKKQNYKIITDGLHLVHFFGDFLLMDDLTRRSVNRFDDRIWIINKEFSSLKYGRFKIFFLCLPGPGIPFLSLSFKIRLRLWCCYLIGKYKKNWLSGKTLSWTVR